MCNGIVSFFYAIRMSQLCDIVLNLYNRSVAYETQDFVRCHSTYDFDCLGDSGTFGLGGGNCSDSFRRSLSNRNCLGAYLVCRCG